MFGDRTNDFTVYDTVYLKEAQRHEVDGIKDTVEYFAPHFWTPIPFSSGNRYEHNVLSTKTWFENNLDKPDYFRAIKVIRKDLSENSIVVKDIAQSANIGQIDVEEGRVWDFAYLCSYPSIESATIFGFSTNYKIRDVLTLPPVQIGDAPDRTALDTPDTLQIYAKNASVANYASFLSTERPINYGQAGPFIFGYLKYDRDVFEDLSTIQYVNNNNEISQNTIYAGDVFNESVNLVEYRAARELNTPNTVDFKVLSLNLSFQTKENYALRHGDKDPQYSYFQFDPSKSYINSGNDLAKYLGTKVYFDDVDTGFDSPRVYPESYLYNPDYSILSSPERYQSLPTKFDYCNDCSGKHPFRIYYSQLDNQEGLEDNYLKILPISYKDLDGAQGPITALVNNFNNLYALTTHTTYFLPTRPQQLGTNESTIYIGTGEVLSIPPRQLKVTDYEFGGTEYQSSVTSTEYGTFFVDNLSGNPFMLTDNLNSLSDGLRNF